MRPDQQLLKKLKGPSLLEEYAEWDRGKPEDGTVQEEVTDFDSGAQTQPAQLPIGDDESVDQPKLNVEQMSDSNNLNRNNQ